MKVDLHLHTTASDGLLTPARLQRFLQEKGVALLAITDHDSVAGIGPEQLASPEVLPGIELSADWGEMHILGYQLDVSCPELVRTLQTLQEYRNRRNPQILAKLRSLGMDITEQEVLAQGNGSMGRPHIARVMVKKGYVASMKEAFDTYLATGKLAYVERRKLSPAECISLIQTAGGVPVLAHPCTLNAEPPALYEIVKGLKEKGLMGMEVYYPGQQANQAAYLEITRQLGLISTGGSDYHGGEEIYSLDTDACPGLSEAAEFLRNWEK